MTVVFTTIFGGSDSLKPAPTGADHCVCFTDAIGEHDTTQQGWTLFGQAVGEPRRDAWRMRCKSIELFPQADRTVWIDASFTLTDLPRLLRDAGTAPIAALRHHRRASITQEAKELVAVGQARQRDIDRQLDDYAEVGFAASHLSISCVIVRDRSEPVRRFNETWAAQIETHLGDNTQLSLDYSAWANGLTIAPLRGTRHQNPYSTHDHADHKKRRKPYQLPGAGA